jgi:hypothetical protein
MPSLQPAGRRRYSCFLAACDFLDMAAARPDPNLTRKAYLAGPLPAGSLASQCCEAFGEERRLSARFG